MRKVKHNKIRNTGLLFEILLRQVTADILDKRRKNKALDIIKENFNKIKKIFNAINLDQDKDSIISSKKIIDAVFKVLKLKPKINAVNFFLFPI